MTDKTLVGGWSILFVNTNTFFKNIKALLALSLCLFVIISCKSDDNDDVAPTPTRTFSMGFTPWPYAATTAAIDEIYSFIGSSADLIAIHMDGGVPWPEANTADNFNNYGVGVKNEVNGIAGRLASLPDHEVYLAVSAFNGLRNDIALYWNTSTGQALPSPWDTYDIDNAAITTSFSNYVDELIKKLNPKYVNFGIEINEFYHNVPADRTKLQIFYTTVYSALKTKYPNIIFMTSFAMSSPGSTKMLETATLYSHLQNHQDMTGISIYPYAFFSHSDKGDPANLPSDWLSQITTIAPGSSYFIAESGFVGESLSIPAFSLNVTTDEDKQNAFLTELFNEANALNVEGLVWFSAYDFDDLWTSSLGDNLSLVWRDIGLKDGSQNPRKSLETWNAWKNRTQN